MRPSHPASSTAGQGTPWGPGSARSNLETAPPEVSFIVPCYQSGGTIGKTLSSILAQDTPLRFEVLVVESSNDGTAESLRQQFPQITSLLFPSGLIRVGLGTSVQSGRRDATSPSSMPTSSSPQSGWSGSVRGCLVGRRSGWSRRRLPMAIQQRPVGCCTGLSFLIICPDFRPAFVPHCSSSNLLVHRCEFASAGGFDEGMAMAEDLLLSKELSGRLYFEGSTAVRHYFRLDWVGVRAHLQALGYWSGYYRRQHQGSGSWLRHLPLLSFGLPWFRLPRILGRVFYSNPLQGLNALAHLPLILAGLFSWVRGFYGGIRVEGDHQE